VSDLHTAPADQQKVTEKREQVVAEAPAPLVVITEQQVAFSTAAAVSLPMTKPKRGLLTAMRGMFAHASEEPIADHVPPRHYPPRREEFLEDAAMAREMRRL
jgi:hypothetical protein